VTGEALRGTYAPPIVSGEPVEIAAGVYVISDNRVPLVPNVGIVVGDLRVLVIDTGVGPRNGAYVLERARRLAQGRPIYLAVTQVDPGHAFGAQAFVNEATIVYSAAQLHRLRSEAPGYAPMFLGIGPEVADQLTGLELVESAITYTGSLEIDLGGVRARLREWGVSHTSDDQTILIDDRALFGGDLFQTRMFPILPFIPPFDTHFDGDRWIAVLDELARMGVPVVIPGHGEVTDSRQIHEVRENLLFVRDESRRLLQTGMSLEDAAGVIETESLRRWPDWEGPVWIRATVRAFSESPIPHR